MRTRAYRPEPPACLEDRSLLSGGLRTSPFPAAISHRRFNFVRDHIGQGFDQAIRNQDASQIINEVDDVLPLIPHARAVDLEGSVQRIVDQMRRDIAAGVPDAVRTAYVEVIGAVRAAAQSRRGSAG